MIQYDFIIVGGGISGISVAEMLSRSGSSCLLLEKNNQLASETSRIFHEWFHMGSLFSLVPDNYLTTRYLLGAVDDLLLFYSNFPNFNLKPSFSGLKYTSDVINPWFNKDKILFRYRNRPFNPIWQLLVARSIQAVKKISSHDWSRKRAGNYTNPSLFELENFSKLYRDSKSKFYEIESPDMTFDSRRLMSDLIKSYKMNGGQILCSTSLKKYQEFDRGIEVQCEDEIFLCSKLILCCADSISDFTNISLKKSYSPIFVVDRMLENQRSFVELDYYPKRCINLLVKNHGYGLAGGISVDEESQLSRYEDYCISEHTKRNPSIRILDKYIGVKKELVLKKNEQRNYQYHINNISSNVVSSVLGKFSLFPSLAAEIYRQIFGENPPLSKQYLPVDHIDADLSNTYWYDHYLQNNNQEKKES